MAEHNDGSQTQATRVRIRYSGLKLDRIDTHSLCDESTLSVRHSPSNEVETTGLFSTIASIVVQCPRNPDCDEWHIRLAIAPRVGSLLVVPAGPL